MDLTGLSSWDSVADVKNAFAGSLFPVGFAAGSTVGGVHLLRRLLLSDLLVSDLLSNS